MNTTTALIALSIPFVISCAFLPNALSGIKGSGVPKAGTRQVHEFVGVRLEIAGRVEVKIGNARSVTVKADDNLLPLITTGVKDGVLVIGSKRQFSAKSPVVVTIVTPHFRSANIAGAGAIIADGIHEPSFAAQIDGAGDIIVTGVAKEVAASVNGTGTLALYNLKSQNATASINGAGKIELNTSDALTAAINGVGSIRYKGQPSVTSTRNGVGTIGPA